MSTGDNRLGRIGIWSLELRFGDRGQAAEAAAELDELGYGAIWVPGGVGGDITGDLDFLLGATRRATIATGIINIWKHEPEEIVGWWKGLPADRQHRLMLGLGISHPSLIGDAYRKPLAVMRDYLDRIAAAGLPPEAMCLAALGPRMLELARDRTAGAHPYNVTPEHSTIARKVLGPGKLLAPEQAVVLEGDPNRAREIARGFLKHYLEMPNYTNNFRRLGFTEDDIRQASDRLVDGIIAWGSIDQIRERVNAHIANGADHVCVQAITGALGAPDFAAARSAWRELAAALL